MISVNLPIYQAKARKAQKFNAAPKVGPGFPLGVEPPRASANEPPRKTLTRRSWSVWLVTSSCCALCGDLVATTVRYLESATRGGGEGVVLGALPVAQDLFKFGPPGPGPGISPFQVPFPGPAPFKFKFQRFQIKYSGFQNISRGPLPPTYGVRCRPLTK